MAFMDNTLSFSSNWSTAQTVTATAASTNVVDLTGAGSGNAPAMINGFPATNTSIGYDIGAGDGEAIPYLYISVPTAGTGAGTVTIALQVAADNGSYSPGTWETLWTSTAIVGTSLVAGSIILVPVPPLPYPADYETNENMPRFLRLNYTVASTFSAGFLAGLMLNPPTSFLLGQYSNNFAVV